MVQELCWQASKQIKMMIIIIIIVIIIIISSSSKMVLDLPTPEGWKAWVDLGYPAMHWPGVKLSIFQSLVRRPTTTVPSQPTG